MHHFYLEFTESCELTFAVKTEKLKCLCLALAMCTINMIFKIVTELCKNGK